MCYAYVTSGGSSSFTCFFEMTVFLVNGSLVTQRSKKYIYALPRPDRYHIAGHLTKRFKPIALLFLVTHLFIAK